MVDYDFVEKGISFSGVCNVPNAEYQALVVGNDRRIRCTNDKKNACDAGSALSQVQILASGKAFFAGVGQEGVPGAIQIWKFPLEKINIVQAHGKGISRMRISFDN